MNSIGKTDHDGKGKLNPFLQELGRGNVPGGRFSIPMMRAGKWVGVLTGSVEILDCATDQDFQPRMDHNSSAVLRRRLDMLHRWQSLADSARDVEEFKAATGVATVSQVPLRVRAKRESSSPACGSIERSGAPQTIREVRPDVPVSTAESSVQESEDLGNTRVDMLLRVRVHNFQRSTTAPAAEAFQRKRGGYGLEDDDAVTSDPNVVDADDSDGEEDEEQDDENGTTELATSEEENEDAEQGVDDVVGASEASDAILVNDVVVLTRTGEQIPLDKFVCCITGERLAEKDFVIVDDEPLSRNAFLEKYRDHVDAATLEPLRPGDNVVRALGYRWKLENFRCSHTGKPLSYGEFFQRDGKPYSEQGFCERFRVCPGCSDVVEISDASGIFALGHVWHLDHFCCSNPECVEPSLQERPFYSKVSVAERTL